MNAHATEMPVNNNTSSLRYAGLLTLLIACAMLLSARICYMYLAQPQRFPINKVSITASYQHISHQELEEVLSPYLESSFFSLPVTKLEKSLNDMPWVEEALVERIWSDELKITLVEKKPVAIWKNNLISDQGELFTPNHASVGYNLPLLKGPETQYKEVLQVYQKLGKILSVYGLYATTLQLRNNQAWVLTLASGVHIYLGKNALEERLLRFCKAYPAVFAEKAEDLASVDLRYPSGMAVQWKQQSEK